MKLLPVFYFLATLCQAQTLDLKSLDRFASKANETVDVHLDGSMLKLAAAFLSGAKADEAQVKKLVEGLTGVYVKSFEFNKVGEFTDADLDAVRAQLKPPAWSRIVSVKSQNGETSEVYLRAADTARVGGLTVISAEPKELTVLQVLGTISLSDLGALSSIPGIPDIKTKPGQKEEE
jgi:hypothetical protein